MSAETPSTGSTCQPSPTGYDGQVDGGATPALDLLLGVGWAERANIDADGTPLDCTACPFSSRSVEPYEQISNDVSEAHYCCSLLDKKVWGEYAPCGPMDWKPRARVEAGRG